MNKTEILAHNWLLANGYTGLVFRSHKTPDFLTEQGQSFEVKLARNGTIWFACDQFEDLILMDNAKVLVFGDKSFPDAIIPAEELRTRPQVWKNVRVLVAAQHRGVINIRFNDGEYELLEEIAEDANRSVYHWCKETLLKQLTYDVAYKYPEQVQIGIDRRLSEGKR